MSLSLIQGYSSAEEDNDGALLENDIVSDEEEAEEDAIPIKPSKTYKPLLDPNPPSSSSLPSAFEAFSEVQGPPQFLNNSAAVEDESQFNHASSRSRQDKKNLPPGVVVESKAQLVGIHERVRSDIGKETSQTGSAAQGGKRLITAQNPNAEDAAELLRMCVRCGIPKTFTHGKGIVCPVCKDRPADQDTTAVKKKGSTVKDKEKSKRMKGQSSHAAWKSETEMQLRQQFD